MARQVQDMFAGWEAEQRKQKEEREEEERRNWKMDSELSSATLTITPIELEDGSVVYRMREAVEVCPYPNPLSFGGSWGGGGDVRSKAEVRAAEKLFLETLSTWDIIDESFLKDHGMTRISVVWEDKVTHVKYLNDQRAEREEEQPLLLV